jgi:hypothetical protein
MKLKYTKITYKSSQLRNNSGRYTLQQFFTLSWLRIFKTNKNEEQKKELLVVKNVKVKKCKAVSVHATKVYKWKCGIDTSYAFSTCDLLE